MRFILYGFLVHIVLLLSIFDIYFKSPIIHGIVPFSNPSPAPAKRLVLFVADGLRADSFYETNNSQSNAPYLRSIIENRGAWGVSHTRVPTESRPGHVALIAGFYEDPSAVAKGWKENPVEFDSVFNQSRYTWSWGSPDILPMFAKGASGNHVSIDMYDSNDEDFSGAYSTTKLDTWVFSKVEAFLKTAKTDPSLNEKLQSDKIVLFFHLLGLDTAGHTHKPHSKEYDENIRVVDKGIETMERIIEEFYQFDNQTAYIFTADHGMTDWGSHGAGDKSETETPLVTWGAGLSGSKTVSTPHHSPSEWKLDHLLRRDVRQADIAPLMSILIGVAIPVNSVGTIPLDHLNVTDWQLSEAMFSNAWQMVAHYSKKRELTEFGTLPWLYRPFKDLSQEKEEMMLKQIRTNIVLENHNQVIKKSQELILLALAGLEYYQNYYQCLLLSCVSLTFIGWITLLLWILLPKSRDSSQISSKHRSNVAAHNHNYRLTDRLSDWCSDGGYALNFTFVILIVSTAFLIFVQLLPVQFYVYCILPEVLWWSVARCYKDFLNALSATKRSIGFVNLCLYSLFYLVGIEIMVLSFFYRYTLSIGVLGLGMWPLMSSRARSAHWTLLLTWFASSILLAVFPMLPVVGRDANINLVALSGWLWLLFAALFALRPVTHLVYDKKGDSRVFYITLVQLFMLPIAVWNLQETSASFKNKEGLHFVNQVLSWFMFGISFVLALCGSRWMLARLLNVSLALAIPFLLLSVSHEGLFLLALTINMLCWLIIEHFCYEKNNKKLSEFSFRLINKVEETERPLSSSDFRRAFFFLLYIILSFFGTGNVASINSFDPAWVRSFLSVFSPFVMATLILWKTMVPFLAITCSFRALNIIVQAPIGKLFLIVLVFCDTMGLHFLHLVTNQGSWLDIGTSISHYVILQSITLFLVVLYGVARVLTSATLWPSWRVKDRSCARAYTSLEVGGAGENNRLRKTVLNRSVRYAFKDKRN